MQSDIRPIDYVMMVPDSAVVAGLSDFFRMHGLPTLPPGTFLTGGQVWSLLFPNCERTTDDIDIICDSATEMHAYLKLLRLYGWSSEPNKSKTKYICQRPGSRKIDLFFRPGFSAVQTVMAFPHLYQRAMYDGRNLLNFVRGAAPAIPSDVLPGYM